MRPMWIKLLHLEAKQMTETVKGQRSLYYSVTHLSTSQTGAHTHRTGDTLDSDKDTKLKASSGHMINSRSWMRYCTPQLSPALRVYGSLGQRFMTFFCANPHLSISYSHQTGACITLTPISLAEKPFSKHISDLTLGRTHPSVLFCSSFVSKLILLF